MKRRDFFKKLGVVCGAAVVCPAELLRPDTMLEDLRVPSDAGLKRWPKYHAECQKKHMKEIVEAFEREFWNTKFKSPFIMLQIDP